MTNSPKFNIREDLKYRSLCQQAEILWISGPTYHDTGRIAEILCIPESDVEKLVRQSIDSRQRKPCKRIR